jgi:hypothetical protein
MNHQEILFARKITDEYLKFLKKTGGLVEETKRATVFTLKATLIKSRERGILEKCKNK